MQDFKFKILP